MSAHIMGPTRVGHGLSQCTKCHATDREITFALGPVCPVASEPIAHTSGPWLVNPASAWIEVPDADAPICAMLWPTDLRSEDETFANARLIAAAPDLLEALEALADDVGRLKSDIAGAPTMLGSLIEARIIIAKARGAS